MTVGSSSVCIRKSSHLPTLCSAKVAEKNEFKPYGLQEESIRLSNNCCLDAILTRLFIYFTKLFWMQDLESWMAIRLMDWPMAYDISSSCQIASLFSNCRSKTGEGTTRGFAAHQHGICRALHCVCHLLTLGLRKQPKRKRFQAMGSAAENIRLSGNCCLDAFVIGSSFISPS